MTLNLVVLIATGALPPSGTRGGADGMSSGEDR